MTKTFTIQEAQELIPVLKQELQVLRKYFIEMSEIWSMNAQKYNLDLEDPELNNICLKDVKNQELIDKIEASLMFFKELGIECKGIEEGLFDFPCLIEDRIVYLCWKEGEDCINHWHEIDSGYSARKSLLEAVGAERNHAIMN